MLASAEPRAGRQRQAAQKLLRLHSFPTGALQLDDPHRPVPARNSQPIIQQGAGLAATLSFGAAHDLDPNRFAADREFKPRAWKRRKPANTIVHLVPRLAPVDSPVIGID